MKSILFALIFLLSVSPSEAQQIERIEQPTFPEPVGWTVYPTPAVDSKDRRCGNYSRREWLVSHKEGKLAIEILPPGSYRQDPLPFKIAKGAGIGGQRRVHKLADGWLVGFDAGEFGGSLWWFSQDGKRRNKLGDGNVKYFVELPKHLLVLEGLAHLDSATGSVLSVSKAESGQYRSELVARLDGEPYAFAQDSENSLIVITTFGLRRFETSGAVKKLHETDFGTLYPNSMTLGRGGVIFIGMRHFVVRLTPTNSGYKEEWLVSDDCKTFYIDERNLNCVCSTPKK